jgi:hypothetical protein
MGDISRNKISVFANGEVIRKKSKSRGSRRR